MMFLLLAGIFPILFGLLCCGIVILYLMLILLHKNSAKCNCEVDLRGKTILITGGSSGIGLATAHVLASRGARIILASKCLQRGLAAAQQIRERCPNKAQVVYYEVDLSDLLSVRQFAQTIVNTEPQLHVLINNAGIAYTPWIEERTKQGYDRVFTTNYLGHFLLTYLLKDLLIASAPSRIINVSSMAHAYVVSPLNLSLHDPKHGNLMYPRLQGYDVSKLAMVLHAKELTRRLACHGVTANAVHPGLVMTGLWTNMTYFWPQWLATLTYCLLWPVSSTPLNAAQTTIHCAVSPDLVNTSGKYFEKCKVKKECEQARDADLAQRLWDVSLLLTGCTQNGHVLNTLSTLSYESEANGNVIYEHLKNPYYKNMVKPLEEPEGLKIENR